MRQLFIFMVACVILAGVAGPDVRAELGTLRESKASQDERKGKVFKHKSGKNERPEGWYASEEYPQAAQAVSGSTKKMGRGFINILTSLFEVPISVRKVSAEQGWAKGVTRGFGRGIFRVAQRVGTSLYDIVTFPVGHESEPLMSPEYVLSGEKEALDREREKQIERKLIKNRSAL